MYNSFTSTHPVAPGLNPSEAAAARLEAAANRRMGVDAYALRMQAAVRGSHEWIVTSARDARNHGCSTWLSRYEDMVTDPRGWSERFASVMRLDAPLSRKALADWAAQQSRIRPDESSHTAYVHPGAFASRLQPPTILQLIANLSRKQLQRSGYF